MQERVFLSLCMPWAAGTEVNSRFPPAINDSGLEQESRERPPVWNGCMGFSKEPRKSRKFMQLSYLQRCHKRAMGGWEKTT